MIILFELVESWADHFLVRRVKIENSIGPVPVLDAVSEVETVDVDVPHPLGNETDAFPDARPAMRAATGPSTIISPSLSRVACKTARDCVGGSNCSFDAVNVDSLELRLQLTSPTIVELATVDEEGRFLEEEKGVVADRLEKIDERSVSIIVNFYSAGLLCKEYAGSSSEDFDIDPVRRQQLDQFRCKMVFAPEVGKGRNSLPRPSISSRHVTRLQY